VTAPFDLSRDIIELTPRLVTLRRALHQRPELAFEEVWTAATLAERMRALGLDVQERIGGTGVLAMLDGTRAGKTLLVRADIDAVAVAETDGRPYASMFSNRSHCCGHDVHAAIVVGVAEVLRKHRDRFAGRVAFVFQPADEPMRGARRMIEDGLLDLVAAHMSLGVHVLPMINVGEVVVQRGPLWASWDTRVFTISGPAPSLDAAVPFDIVRVAARVATALYDFVEQEACSAEPVIFRLRSLEATQSACGDPSQAAIEVHMGRGDPSQAVIEINLSLFDNALRVRMLDAINHLAAAIVETAGGTLSAKIDYALPALVNDDHVTGALERAAERVVGRAGIVDHWRNRFSDDFGLFMAAVPGSLMLLGTANPAKGITEIWHRPGFDVDEDALPLGVEIMTRAVLDLLR